MSPASLADFQRAHLPTLFVTGVPVLLESELKQNGGADRLGSEKETLSKDLRYLKVQSICQRKPNKSSQNQLNFCYSLLNSKQNKQITCSPPSRAWRCFSCPDLKYQGKQLLHDKSHALTSIRDQTPATPLLRLPNLRSLKINHHRPPGCRIRAARHGR